MRRSKKESLVVCAEGHKDHRFAFVIPALYRAPRDKIEEFAKAIHCTADEVLHFHSETPSSREFWINTFRIFGPCVTTLKIAIREQRLVEVSRDIPFEGTTIGIVGPATNLSKRKGFFDKPEEEYLRCNAPNTSDRAILRLSTKRFPTREDGPFEGTIYFNMFEKYKGVHPKFKKERKSGSLESRTGLVTVFMNTEPFSISCAHNTNDKSSEFCHVWHLLLSYVFPKAICGAMECSKKAKAVCVYSRPILSEGGEDLLKRPIPVVYMIPACSNACQCEIDKEFTGFLGSAASRKAFESGNVEKLFRFRSHICSVCTKDTHYRCPCGKSYCSGVCQRADFFEHKKECSYMKKK